MCESALAHRHLKYINRLTPCRESVWPQHLVTKGKWVLSSTKTMAAVSSLVWPLTHSEPAGRKHPQLRGRPRPFALSTGLCDTVHASCSCQHGLSTLLFYCSCFFSLTCTPSLPLNLQSCITFFINQSAPLNKQKTTTRRLSFYLLFLPNQTQSKNILQWSIHIFRCCSVWLYASNKKKTKWRAKKTVPSWIQMKQQLWQTVSFYATLTAPQMGCSVL